MLVTHRRGALSSKTLAAVWGALLMAGCLVMSAADSAAADRVGSERRLPKGTLAYVSLHDIAASKTRFGGTNLGRMVSDPAMADFHKQIAAHWQPLSDAVEKQIGLNLEGLLAIPQGEVAVAIFQAPGRKIDGVLFLEYGEQKEAIVKLLDKAVESARESGATVEEDSFNDLTVHVVTIPAKGDEEDDSGDDGDAAGARADTTLAYVLHEGQLLLSSSADGVKDVLRRWDGRHDDVFADNSAYQSIQANCRSEDPQDTPLLSWFIDPVGLVRAAVLSNEDVSPQTTMVLGFLPTLGIDKWRAVGGTLDMAEGEYDSITRTLFVVDEPSTGLMNMLHLPASGQTPPNWVAATASSYGAINWDVAKAYDAVEALVDSFQGAGTFATAVEQIAENPAAGGLHPKTDFLDHLSGQFHLVGYDPEDADAEESVLLAAGLSNPGAMKTTLRKVASLPGFTGKVREFQGETLIEIKAADEETEDGDESEESGPAKAMGIAVANGCLFLALDVADLEDILRGEGQREPLAESEAYRKLARMFPTKTSVIGFERADLQIKSAYEILRSGQLTGTIEGMPDFSTLPEFSTIRKYLSPTGSYMHPVEKGMRIVSFQLRQE